MSRHQSLVATSAQVFCRLQMVAPDVATSISCRDINLMNCSFQLMSFVVATSILCRDITSCLCRFHWLLLVSRHQLLSRQQLKSQQFHLFKPVITSRRFSCRDLHSLSRHQPLVSAQSSAAYLVIPIATCIKFPSIFLMSQPHNWTLQTPKLQH